VKYDWQLVDALTAYRTFVRTQKSADALKRESSEKFVALSEEQKAEYIKSVEQINAEEDGRKV
jgi:hypothetical protein